MEMNSPSSMAMKMVNTDDEQGKTGLAVSGGDFRRGNINSYTTTHDFRGATFIHHHYQSPIASKMAATEEMLLPLHDAKEEGTTADGSMKENITSLHRLESDAVGLPSTHAADPEVRNQYLPLSNVDTGNLLPDQTVSTKVNGEDDLLSSDSRPVRGEGLNQSEENSTEQKAVSLNDCGVEKSVHEYPIGNVIFHRGLSHIVSVFYMDTPSNKKQFYQDLRESHFEIWPFWPKVHILAGEGVTVNVRLQLTKPDAKFQVINEKPKSICIRDVVRIGYDQADFLIDEHEDGASLKKNHLDLTYGYQIDSGVWEEFYVRLRWPPEDPAKKKCCAQMGNHLTVTQKMEDKSCSQISARPGATVHTENRDTKFCFKCQTDY